MLAQLFYRARKDVHFRIKLFLCASFIFNVLYAVFLFVVARVYASKWFFVMSIYYGLLSIARIFVFLQINPQKTLFSKIKTMRACGVFLLIVNLAVSTMMFILLYGNPPVKHHEITVIALATYTFSTLTVAIVNSVKYLKRNDHVYACVKLISLICASVSMVTLTNTMLVTFGEENMLLRSIILPILCAVVSIFIIMSAILMIRKANFDLRMTKNEQQSK